MLKKKNKTWTEEDDRRLPDLSEEAVKEIEDSKIQDRLKHVQGPPSGNHWADDFPSRFSLMRLRGSNASGNLSEQFGGYARDYIPATIRSAGASLG
jgi:hypothetical protein